MNSKAPRVLHVPPRPLALALAGIMAGGGTAHAEDWKGLRISPSGSAGQWTEVPCESGSGWQLCQPPLTLSAVAQPASIIGLPIHTTQITATLRDAFGNLIEPGVAVKWTATRGTLSSTTTYTDSNGRTQVTLAAFKELGGSTVTATAQTDEGGTASVFVSFIDSWLPISPILGSWTNSGGVYSCTAWSPAANTVTAGQSFTQTRSCSQGQTRTRQNREQSEVTGNIRNNGAQFNESQVITVSQSQGATGTYVPITLSVPSGGWVGGCNVNHSDIPFSRTGAGTVTIERLPPYNISVPVYISGTNIRVNHKWSPSGWQSYRLTMTSPGGNTISKDITINYEGGSNCSCFTAGSLVRMADGSLKPIETIRVGEWVKTAVGVARVYDVELPKLGQRALYALPDGSFRTSGEHSFWSRDPASGKQWWATRDIDQWRLEAENGTGPNFNGHEPFDLTEREGDEWDFATETGWLRSAWHQVQADPETQLYHLRVEEGGSYFVDGILVSSVADEADVDWENFDWTP